jgi:hypothetical protein
MKEIKKPHLLLSRAPVLPPMIGCSLLADWVLAPLVLGPAGSFVILAKTAAANIPTPVNRGVRNMGEQRA